MDLSTEAQSFLHAAQHYKRCCHWEIHNLLSELLKLLAMQWLGHVVSHHLISWAELYTDVTFLLFISNKEVSNVNVPGPLAGTLPAIPFQ